MYKTIIVLACTTFGWQVHPAQTSSLQDRRIPWHGGRNQHVAVNQKFHSHLESDILEHIPLKALALLLLQPTPAVAYNTLPPRVRSSLDSWRHHRGQLAFKRSGSHKVGLKPSSVRRLPVRRSRISMNAGTEFPPSLRYTWRGHSCSFVKAGQGPPILLLHGFAGSAYNCWRSNLNELAKTHTVYALDLLGLGASDQPAGVEYGIDLWREQCEAFISEHMNEQPIVIGHAFGSLLALELARESFAKGMPIRAVGLMSCTIGVSPIPKNSIKVEEWLREQAAKGLNVRAATPIWQLGIANVVFSFWDTLFNQPWLLQNLVGNLNVEGVRGGLKNSYYVNVDRVTDDLVRDYLAFTRNKEAAAEVLRQILTNDGGPLPFPAAQALPDDFPLLVVWGRGDKVSNISGTLADFFRERSRQLAATRFEEVTAGHVPQDDNPDVTGLILKEWLATL